MAGCRRTRRRCLRARPASRPAIRRRPRSRARAGIRGGATLELQAVGDRVEARFRAGLVRIPAWRAGNTDSAEERAARLDHEAAAHRDKSWKVANPRHRLARTRRLLDVARLGAK